MDPLTAYQGATLALGGASMLMSFLGGRKADKNAAKHALLDAGPSCDKPL